MADNKTDPIAEAEVYIAYGRLEQAAQVLREAIEREPNRKDLWNKLAEIIRREPSAGSSPAASFEDSSGHEMDADDTELFKIGIVEKCYWLILSGFIIFFIADAVRDRSSSPFTWGLFLAIATLYILFIIDFISCSIILTKDRMIVSRIARSRSFGYTEIGKIYFWDGGRWCCTIIYSKEGKRVFTKIHFNNPYPFIASLRRRANKYGSVYVDHRNQELR